MELTDVPSQTRQNKRNNAVHKSTVIDQVRKKSSEPDLDHNKHGDNKSTSHDNKLYPNEGRLQNTAKEVDSQIKAQKKSRERTFQQRHYKKMEQQ